MSKKKGQKWGMEKTSVSRSNSYEVSRKESWEKTTIEEGELVHDSVDFEKLKPLSCLPKEGDIVAYRLVELSSSWCPELSPFRVGKISWYDSESNRIMLVPVPGFPIVSDAKRDADNEEETAQETQSSLYKEDGSLEIDFVSLIDVRMFNYGDFDPASVVTDGNNEAPASNEEAGWGNNKAPASNKEAGCGNNKATASNKETGWGNSKAPASDKEAGWNNRKAPASNKEAGWSTNKATASNKETGWGNSKAPASNQEAGCRNSKAPASNKEAGWGATAANDKHEEATLVTNGSNPASNKESGSGWKSKVTHEERQASTTGNDKSLDVWEEISQALNEKKSQLSQKNGWGDKKAGSSKGQWSYKALRSSALGPTMAILRAGNGK